MTFLSLKITFSAARIQFCAVQLSVAVLLPPRLILALLLSVCAKVYVKSLGEEKLPEWVLTLLLYTAVSYSATFFVDFAINLFVSWHAVRSVQKSPVPGSILAVCLHLS